MLASGRGTTLQALLDACGAGQLEAAPVVVLSNNSGSGAAERARESGVAFRPLSSATHPEPAELDSAVLAALEEHAVDLVLLLGYMKKLGPQTLRRYKGRVLNTHPALLPKYGGRGMYGARVHAAVLAAGDAKTGVSIHVVDAEYDTGPVVAQCEVDVREGDTPEALAARVQARERQFLVETLREVVAGRLELS